MKSRTASLLLASIALCGLPGRAVAQQASAAKASIEGIIVRSGTGEPIEGAQVTLGRALVNVVQAIAPPPPRINTVSPTYAHFFAGGL